MSHFVASNAGRGTEVIDPERGLYLLTTGRGAGAGLGASKLTWAIEEAAEDLRKRCAGYERAPSGETRKGVLETLETAIRGVGADVIRGRTPEDLPASSFILVIAGAGFAFVAHRGECRLDVLREGEAHRVTPGDGEAKVYHLDLMPGDRLVLSNRGFAKGALAKLPEPVAGSAEESAKALLTLATAQDAQSTVAVVDPPASREAEALVARARALGKLFLFDGMSFDSRLRVNAICHRKSCAPGQEVVREGEAGDSMFIVIRGHFKVTLGGKELTRLEAGSQFGELALAEDIPRSATVTAIDHADVAEITRRDLTEFGRSNPDEGLQIAWRLVQFLGRRVRDLSDKVAKG